MNLDKVKEEQKKTYNQLFKDDSEKAMAFDKIAENYYFGNFGTMQKSEIDLLIFSLYMDAMIKKSNGNMDEYTSYKLSKKLGITERKIDSLKERKQLIYPVEFNWGKSFLEICGNANYEDNCIFLYISDTNLYKEIRNAVEEEGGYVHGSIASKLLKLPIKYFIPLVLKAGKEADEDIVPLLEELKSSDSDEIKKYIETRYEGKNVDYSWKEVFFNIGEDAVVSIIGNLNPVAGSIVSSAITNVKKKIKMNKESKKVKNREGNAHR